MNHYSFPIFLLLLFFQRQTTTNAAPLQQHAKKAPATRPDLAPIGGDRNLFKVGDSVFKVVAFPKPLSYDAATLYFRRLLGNDTKAQAALATIRNADEESAIETALSRGQVNNAMIGLKLARIAWRWVADSSPVRGQGTFDVPDPQTDQQSLRLSCGKDCTSYCQYNKKRYAQFQEESLKCYCTDAIVFEPSCGTIGCTKADEYSVFDTSNATYDHWAEGRPKLRRGCAALSRIDGNQWVDRQCADRLPFICQFDRWVIASMHIENKACFDNNDKCFALFRESPLPFDEAQQYCLDKNGALLKIDSFERQHNVEIAIVNFTTRSYSSDNSTSGNTTSRLLRRSVYSPRAAQLQNNLISYVWIGASNADYVWPDGSSPTNSAADPDSGYTNWGDKQPDKTYDCVAMVNTNGYGDYEWRTRRCDNANVFVGSFIDVADPTVLSDYYKPPLNDPMPTTTTTEPATTTAQTTPSTTDSSTVATVETTTFGIPNVEAQIAQNDNSTAAFKSVYGCDVTCGVWILLGIICGIELVLIIILVVCLCGRCRKRVHPAGQTPPPAGDDEDAFTVVCCCNADVSKLIEAGRQPFVCCCQSGENVDPNVPNEDATPSCCLLALCSPMVRKVPPPPKELLQTIDEEKKLLAIIESKQKEHDLTLQGSVQVIQELKNEIAMKHEEAKTKSTEFIQELKKEIEAKHEQTRVHSSDVIQEVRKEIEILNKAIEEQQMKEKPAEPEPEPQKPAAELLSTSPIPQPQSAVQPFTIVVNTNDKKMSFGDIAPLMAPGNSQLPAGATGALPPTPSRGRHELKIIVHEMSDDQPKRKNDESESSSISSSSDGSNSEDDDGDKTTSDVDAKSHPAAKSGGEGTSGDENGRDSAMKVKITSSKRHRHSHRRHRHRSGSLSPCRHHHKCSHHRGPCWSDDERKHKSPQPPAQIEEKLQELKTDQVRLLELVTKCAERQQEDGDQTGVPNPNKENNNDQKEHQVDAEPSPRPASPPLLPDSVPVIHIKVKKTKKGRTISRTTVISPRSVVGNAKRRRRLGAMRNPIIIVKQFYPRKKRRQQQQSGKKRRHGRPYVCQCCCRNNRKAAAPARITVSVSDPNSPVSRQPDTPTMVSRSCNLHSNFPHAHGDRFFLGRMRHVDAAYCRNLFGHGCRNAVQKEWLPAAFLGRLGKPYVSPPPKPRPAWNNRPFIQKPLRRPQSAME